MRHALRVDLGGLVRAGHDTLCNPPNQRPSKLGKGNITTYSYREYYHLLIQIPHTSREILPHEGELRLPLSIYTRFENR